LASRQRTGGIITSMDSSRVAVGLFLVGWLVLGIGLVVDVSRGGPESTLRGYLADLEAQRTEAALAVMAPEAAARWRDFIEFQQYNRYEVVSIATRSPSLLESLAQGRPWRATQATLVADVLEPSGVRWRGSTIVPLDFVDGRWMLLRPPFAG
jgi:hypothetical protein